MSNQELASETEDVSEQPMNIGQINGTEGVDKGLDKSQSTKLSKRHQDRAPVQDSALISETSRETLRDLEGISGRLQDDANDRKDLVAEVKGRLESGYLDQADVYRDVARSILSEE